MSISTLGELIRLNEAELLAYKNFGETTLDEIKAPLTKKGLRLGQALEDERKARQQEILKQVQGDPAILVIAGRRTAVVRCACRPCSG